MTRSSFNCFPSSKTWRRRSWEENTVGRCFPLGVFCDFLNDFLDDFLVSPCPKKTMSILPFTALPRCRFSTRVVLLSKPVMEGIIELESGEINVLPDGVGGDASRSSTSVSYLYSRLKEKAVLDERVDQPARVKSTHDKRTTRRTTE